MKGRHSWDQRAAALAAVCAGALSCFAAKRCGHLLHYLLAPRDVEAFPMAFRQRFVGETLGFHGISYDFSGF